MPTIRNENISTLAFLRACSDGELQELWELLKRKEFASRIIIREEQAPSEYMTEINRICHETDTPIKYK